MTKVSDEIKRIMESLPETMIKSPKKIIKTKEETKLESLERMKKECSEAWDRSYKRYLDGDKDITELMSIWYRLDIIDWDLCKERVRIQEQRCVRKE